MAFPLPRPGDLGSVEEATPAEDVMYGISGDDLDTSGSFNEPSPNPTYNNLFYWYQQQQGQPLEQNTSLVNPQDLITQTAPPFRAAQSRHSDLRQYYTESRVNEVQSGHINGFGSVGGIARAEPNAGDPRFLMPGQSGVNNRRQAVPRNNPTFHDFMPEAVDTPHIVSPEPTAAKSPQMNDFGSTHQPPLLGLSRQQSLPIRPPKKRPRHRQSPDDRLPMRASHQSRRLGAVSSTTGHITVGPVINESAVSVFENWLKNYPLIPVPGDEHFKALATLTGLEVGTVKFWFGQKLRQSTTTDLSASATSGTTSILSSENMGIGTTHGPRPHLTFQDSILQQAAAWVRDKKGMKCSESPYISRLFRNNEKPFQCTRKCGKTFSRKDDWRKHEEINCPQEGWLCDLPSVIIRAGVPICTFCSIKNPEPSHMQQMHPRKTPCHDKEFLDQGRISYRQDKFRQHFKNTHLGINCEDYSKGGHFIVQSRFPKGCGFCNYRCIDWQDRIKHIGDHFASRTEGRDMTQWDEPSDDHDQSDNDDDDNDDNDNEDEDNEDDQDAGQDATGDGFGRRENGDTDNDDFKSESSDDDSDDYHPGSGQAQDGYVGFDSIVRSTQCMGNAIGPLYVSPLHGKRHIISKLRFQTSDYNGIVSTTLTRGAERLTCSQAQLYSKKVLGFGPYSVVDEVLHRKSGLILARKTIHYASEESLQSLMSEVNIMKRLHHPHIVRFVDSYKFQNSLSILMTPSADFDLGYFLDTHGGNEDYCMDMMQQWFHCLISTIHYMHSNFIKHQDIKPSNILIRGRSIFLADFGVAKDFIDLESTTSTSGNMTRQYCSPETACRRVRGRGSDIFSLGCVFIEMLSFLLHGGSQAFKDFQKSQFIGDGTFHENLLAIEEWKRYLYAHPVLNSRPYLKLVLDACGEMLQEEPSARPSADHLAKLFSPGECCVFSGEVSRPSYREARCDIPQTSQDIARDDNSMMLLAFPTSRPDFDGDIKDDGYSLRQYLDDSDRREALWLKLAGHIWVQGLFPSNRYCPYLRTQFSWGFDDVHDEKFFEMLKWNLSKGFKIKSQGCEQQAVDSTRDVRGLMRNSKTPSPLKTHFDFRPLLRSMSLIPFQKCIGSLDLRVNEGTTMKISENKLSLLTTLLGTYWTNLNHPTKIQQVDTSVIYPHGAVLDIVPFDGLSEYPDQALSSRNGLLHAADFSASHLSLSGARISFYQYSPVVLASIDTGIANSDQKEQDEHTMATKKRAYTSYIKHRETPIIFPVHDSGNTMLSTPLQRFLEENDGPRVYALPSQPVAITTMATKTLNHGQVGMGLRSSQDSVGSSDSQSDVFSLKSMRSSAISTVPSVTTTATTAENESGHVIYCNWYSLSRPHFSSRNDIRHSHALCVCLGDSKTRLKDQVQEVSHHSPSCELTRNSVLGRALAKHVARKSCISEDYYDKHLRRCEKLNSNTCIIALSNSTPVSYTDSRPSFSHRSFMAPASPSNSFPPTCPVALLQSSKMDKSRNYAEKVQTCSESRSASFVDQIRRQAKEYQLSGKKVEDTRGLDETNTRYYVFPGGTESITTSPVSSQCTSRHTWSSNSVYDLTIEDITFHPEAWILQPYSQMAYKKLLTSMEYTALTLSFGLPILQLFYLVLTNQTTLTWSIVATYGLPAVVLLVVTYLIWTLERLTTHPENMFFRPSETVAHCALRVVGDPLGTILIPTVMKLTNLQWDLFFLVTNICRGISLAVVSQLLKIKPTYKMRLLFIKSSFCMALLVFFSYITGALQATHPLRDNFSAADFRPVESVLEDKVHDFITSDVDTTLLKYFEAYCILDSHWKFLDTLDSATVTSLALRDPENPKISSGVLPNNENPVTECLEFMTRATVLFAAMNSP